MNLSQLVFRYRDFQKPTGPYPQIIITSRGLPIFLKENVVAICSPSLSTSESLGFPYGCGIGYLSHENSIQPVHQAHEGQEIYFWSQEKQRVVYAGQTIRRLYLTTPSISISEIRSLLVQLCGNQVLNLDELHILQEYDLEMYFNRFLQRVLAIALCSENKGWSLTADQSNVIHDLIRDEYPADIVPDLFFADLIYVSKEIITIKPTLVLLLIEAIHKQFSKKTGFNSQNQLIITG